MHYPCTINLLNYTRLNIYAAFKYKMHFNLKNLANHNTKVIIVV